MSDNLQESILKVLQESSFQKESSIPVGYSHRESFFDTDFYFNKIDDIEFAEEAFNVSSSIDDFIEILKENDIDFKSYLDYSGDYEEGDSFRESSFRESISESVNKKVDMQDLLAYASILSKYKSKIYLTVLGKNRFNLELTDKDLINKDNSVKQLFS